MEKNSNNPAVRDALRGGGAFLSMLLGGILMVTLIVSLNKMVDKKEGVLKKQTRIVKLKKTQKQLVQQAKAKPKRKSKAKDTVEPPDLGPLIGGMELNIPQFTVAGITGDAKELLDDIAEDTVMSEDTVDIKPRATFKAPIKYPASAAKNGIEGYVVLNLLIAKDGSIQLSKVLESNPRGVFDNAVLNAIRDWRFTPARYKGGSVPVWVKQKVKFNS